MSAGSRFAGSNPRSIYRFKEADLCGRKKSLMMAIRSLRIKKISSLGNPLFSGPKRAGPGQTILMDAIDSWL
jgi:hypothetical protein